MRADRLTSVQHAGLVFPIVDTGPIDGTPVLLLHGWPQDGGSWTSVADELAASGYRTFAPTLRGAVASANPRRRRAFRSGELLEDVVAIIEAIGMPVHLVGHDWGAALAWTVAARRADLVRTLTAVSVPHPAVFLKALRGPRQASKSWYMALFQLPLLPELGLASTAVRTRALRSSGQSPAGARRDAARLHTHALRRGGLHWYRGAPLTRPIDLGGPVSVPVLQVWSDQDVAIARSTIERSRDYAAGEYELVVLGGVSHWIPDEAPAELARMVHGHIHRSVGRGVVS